MLGTPARLVQPHEAVLLPHGQIAVADTGNRRLAILDATGHLLKSVRTGALQEPYAVVASRSSYDHFILHDQWRASCAVIWVAIGVSDIPEKMSGAGVQTKQMRIVRFHIDA